MRALIMAGGAGSRINLGEKPLILICGQPMIAYVIRAFQNAGCYPVVVVSPQTPMTLNWCRANGIAFCKEEGKGFVEDMIDAVRFLEEEGPLFISVSDIPCITTGIVRAIIEAYDACGKDALSTWVPAWHGEILPGRHAVPRRDRGGRCLPCRHQHPSRGSYR